MKVQLVFPLAKPADFAARPRDLLRCALAQTAGVDPRCVALDRAFPGYIKEPSQHTPSSGIDQVQNINNMKDDQKVLSGSSANGDKLQRVFIVKMTVAVGPELLKGNSLVKAFKVY